MRRLSAFLVVVCMLAAAVRAQPVIYTSSATISDTDLSVDGRDIVVQGCTLTINGVHAFNSLTVARNAANQPGIVTHAAGFKNAQVEGLVLYLAQNLNVEGANGALVASRIDADARGNPSAVGPGLSPAAGTGSCCGRGGSGHGGVGGAGTSHPGGPAYGNDAAPAEFGTGGTPRFSGSNAGAGGGSIRITAGGVISINGVISANAANCAGDNGAPSGGSIRLSAPVIAGVGEISVRGGTNTSGPTGGGGAGGRVALNSCSLQFNLGAVRIAGGTGSQPGSPGSIFLGSGSIVVSQHPQPLTLLNGQTALFSVSAAGNGSLSYQWRRNAVPLSDAGRVSGAASPTLRISNVQTSDIAAYDVLMWDTCGPFASESALLDVFCRADWDHNRQVQPADVASFVQSWFNGVTTGTLTADFDQNGTVDPADVSLFIQVWLGTVQNGC